MRNSDYLEDIYNDLKVLGFVSNQYDFSIMCGRTPAWFSCIKARRLPLTTDAALTLSHNIKAKADTIIDVELHRHAITLSTSLIEQAQQQIGAKLARYSGCSLV
jgi:hypothetical protein